MVLIIAIGSTGANVIIYSLVGLLYVETMHRRAWRQSREPPNCFVLSALDAVMSGELFLLFDQNKEPIL